MNASELILNDDGSIYHLGIRPEHCAPFIITVGDPERVPKVSQFLIALTFDTKEEKFVFILASWEINP